MKKLKDESGEAEQSQGTTGGDSEIAEVFFTGTGFHVGDGYLLTNRHVVVEPWKYDAFRISSARSSVSGRVWLNWRRFSPAGDGHIN